VRPVEGLDETGRLFDKLPALPRLSIDCVSIDCPGATQRYSTWPSNRQEDPVSTDSTPPANSSPSVIDAEVRVQTVCQMIFAAFAVGAALYWLRPVLLPFILALFFVFGLVPVLDYIQRRMKAPRMVAVGVAFMLGLSLISVLVLLIWLSVDSLVRNAEDYRQQFEQWEAHIRPWLQWDVSAGEAGDSASAESEQSLAPSNGAIRSWLGSFSPAVMSFLSSALMVVIFMFFLLLGGSTDIVPRTGFWIEVETSIRQYIVTKTVISMVTGGVVTITLMIFGIPLALIFGIMAFLLNYIPNVGPVIAGLLPVPLILLDPELGIGSQVLAIVLLIVIQFVSGNIVEPKMMGNSVELHPVAILIALLFWGLIWGIVGMFLATPITAAMKILFERFDHTKVIAQVLEGDLSNVSFMADAVNEAPGAVDDTGAAEQV
jgi:AI-2 transport protein TqsA